MKHLSISLFLCLTFFACQQSEADYDIYLCIGQSNMAGRGPIDATVTDTLDNVLLLTNDSDNPWEKAANPLNKYSTIRKNLKMQRVGPSYGFAKAMAELNPQDKIALVVNAKGGTSIRLWHPDSTFFKEAVARTLQAMEYGELKGIIWHQGCSDAGQVKKYMPQLENLVSELRNQLGADVPFVAGQLSFDKELRIPFNEMILTVPDHIPNAAVVLSDGLTTIDNTHFDTKSQLVLGQRYAKEMSLLQENNKK